MALQGYKAEVKVSGTPVSFTAETMRSDDQQEFVIEDPVKQVWDRSAAITVERSTGEDSWAVVAEQEYTLNRLAGKVIFWDAQENASIRVSGSYVPLTRVAGAYEYTYTLECDNQAVPEFSSSYMHRIQGKKDVTGSLTKWYQTSSLFLDSLQSARPVVLEFFTGDAAAPEVRIWALCSTVEMSASQEALVEESIEFEAVADNEGRVISFG